MKFVISLLAVRVEFISMMLFLQDFYRSFLIFHWENEREPTEMWHENSSHLLNGISLPIAFEHEPTNILTTAEYFQFIAFLHFSLKLFNKRCDKYTLQPPVPAYLVNTFRVLKQKTWQLESNFEYDRLWMFWKKNGRWCACNVNIYTDI